MGIMVCSLLWVMQDFPSSIVEQLLLSVVAVRGGSKAHIEGGSALVTDQRLRPGQPIKP